MIARGLGYLLGRFGGKGFTLGVVCGGVAVAWCSQHPDYVPAWLKRAPASVSASMPAWVKNAPAAASSFTGQFLREHGLLPTPRMVIDSDRYHQCHITGLADGAQFRFLADTGSASALSFGPQHVRRLGVDPATLQYNRKIATANGLGRAADIEVHEFRIGEFVLHDVGATVAENLATAPLIGAPLLKQWNFQIGAGACSLSLPPVS
jgi:clan AA aspartic protease (TIGR02281 family)